MIVILCDSFTDAEDCYWLFLEYLEENFLPWNAVRTLDHALIVDTDEDIRYMFVDHRYRYLIFKKTEIDDPFWGAEFVEKELFFEDLRVCE